MCIHNVLLIVKCKDRITPRLVNMGSTLFSSILILLLLFFTHGLPTREELYESSQCKMEDGSPGICKKIFDCPARLQEVLEHRRSSDSTGRCGFQNFTEIVCCSLNITDKIGLRPAEVACREYENEISDTVGVTKLAQEASTEPVLQFNIFAGMPAQRGEFPYIVALGYENKDEDDNSSQVIKYRCGGTLISLQHVLTAAHCVSNVQNDVPIEVRIGSENLTGEEAQRINVNDVITHPRYKRSMNYNDVAILKLEKPVRMANNVKPICIQTKSVDTMDISPNVSFVVIGWGNTNFDMEGSNHLMKTPGLSLVDRESCGKSFNGFNKLPRGLDENMLCAKDTNITRKSDACQGDSGGPLLMLTGSSHSIVGITAFGQACGGSIPGIYMAVYSFLEWIEEEVWPDANDER